MRLTVGAQDETLMRTRHVSRTQPLNHGQTRGDPQRCLCEWVWVCLHQGEDLSALVHQR
jgi:hypothetical protein